MLSTTTFGQRVGLVLSGGGAKGIAHIGIIKALEENNIPIDYIAGTSMGAIIGALYSMGYTTDEMLSLIKSEDFISWSTGSIDTKYLYYFREQEKSPEFISFKLGKNKSLTNILPQSLINPLPMNLGFLSIFTQYTAVCDRDFNKLFVPYRAVASNIYDKKAIVYRTGDLGDAVRASMTFPLVFKPIEIDSIPMFDGGIYNNYPVDVLQKDFSPDYIIGSNVANMQEDKSNKDIVGQIESMIIHETNYNISDDIGISIRSDLHEYGLLNFQKADEIAQKGYDNAISVITEIKSHIPREVSYAELSEKRRKFKEKITPLSFDKVIISGNKNEVINRYIERHFTIKDNDTLSYEDVKRSYYKLLSDTKLSDLIPHGIYNKETGRYTLSLNGKMQSKQSIGFGGYISSGNTNLVYLDFKYQTLKFLSTNLLANGYLGRSYYSGQLNVRFELPTRYPTYLRLDGVIARKKYYEGEELFKIEELPTFITTNESYIKTVIGMPIGIRCKAELSSGYGYLWDTYYPTNIYDYTQDADKSAYHIGITSLDIDFNTLNMPLYPTEGSRFRALGSVVYGKEQYTPAWKTGEEKFRTWVQLLLHAQHYFSLHRQISLGIMGEVVASSKTRLLSYTGTIVQAPGFTPTPHSKMSFNEAFHANQYVAGGIIPIWKPIKNMQLRGEFYAFSPFHKILRAENHKAIYANGFFTHVEFLGEISLIYKLPFATLSAYGNYYSYPSKNWNFGISLGFLIYNPRFWGN